MKVFGKTGEFKIHKGSIVNPISSYMGYIVTLVNKDGTLKDDDSLKLSKRWPIIQKTCKATYITKFGQVPPGELAEAMLLPTLYSYNCFVYRDDVLDEDALRLSFTNLAKLALNNKASIHISKNDSWDQIKGFITDLFINKGVSVVAYDG